MVATESYWGGLVRINSSLPVTYASYSERLFSCPRLRHHLLVFSFSQPKKFIQSFSFTHMHAVYTLSTKFWGGHYTHGGFPDAEAFACSCVLSVQLARQQLGRAELYTDSRGARLFARLQLPFDAVHVVLDDFSYPPHLWMASKLLTYRRQTEPFVHLDLDAYLWAPLPARLTGVAVIAQSSEEDYGYYDAVVAYFLQRAGYQPDFICQHAVKYGAKVRALNAGLYGGHDLASLHASSEAALATIAHPANAAMFAQLLAGRAGGGELFYDFNVLLEQYYAGVYCYERGIEVGYVLKEQEPPYFTHLLAGAKRHPDHVAHLKARVARDYPHHYHLARQAG